MGNDSELDNARQVLKADYWRSVKSHADEIIKEIRNGNIASASDLDQRLNEDAGGSSWAIYPLEALSCLLATNNDNAAEEAGADLRGSGGRGTYCEIAMWAFQADLSDTLEEDGICLFDPAPKCGNCGCDARTPAPKTWPENKDSLRCADCAEVG
jgi:hypothetical protein